MGLYLSQHPLNPFETILAEQTVPLNTLKPEHDGRAVTVGGAVSEVREITTKTGQRMAFVKLADQFGELELILFPSMYQQTTGIWERDRVVLIKGKLNAKDREGQVTSEVKLLVDDAREITPEQAAAYTTTGRKKTAPKANKKAVAAKAAVSSATPVSKCFIRVVDSSNHELLQQLKAVLDSSSGDTEVVLVLGAEDHKQIVRLPVRINYSDACKTALEKLVSADNIKLQ